jgi:hypothetical protein
MLMPATLGLGLALAGCNSDGLASNEDDGGQRQDGGKKTEVAGRSDASISPPDTGGAVMKYMAQLPDAGQDLGTIGLLYMAPAPAYMAPHVDADAGRPIAIYMAQAPLPRS